MVTSGKSSGATVLPPLRQSATSLEYGNKDIKWMARCFMQLELLDMRVQIHKKAMGSATPVFPAQEQLTSSMT